MSSYLVSVQIKDMLKSMPKPQLVALILKDLEDQEGMKHVPDLTLSSFAMAW